MLKGDTVLLGSRRRYQLSLVVNEQVQSVELRQRGSAVEQLPTVDQRLSNDNPLAPGIRMVSAMRLGPFRQSYLAHPISQYGKDARLYFI